MTTVTTYVLRISVICYVPFEQHILVATCTLAHKITLFQSAANLLYSIGIFYHVVGGCELLLILCTMRVMDGLQQ